MHKLHSRAWLATAATFVALSLVATTALAAGHSITELKTTDTTVGSGAQATPGAKVTVDYTGWLYDAEAKNHHGEKFDSSKDRGQPFSFTLGAGQVIKGWDQGVEGMQVGGERTIIIPSDLAYGSRGAGNSIPPNATLIFDVELRDVEKQLPRSLNWQDSQSQ